MKVPKIVSNKIKKRVLLKECLKGVMVRNGEQYISDSHYAIKGKTDMPDNIYLFDGGVLPISQAPNIESVFPTKYIHTDKPNIGIELLIEVLTVLKANGEKNAGIAIGDDCMSITGEKLQAIIMKLA